MVDFLRRDMAKVMTMPIAQQRVYFEERAKFAPRPKSAKVRREEVQIAGMEACWFVPDNENPGATLVYWHGGGFCICSVDTHADLISRIAYASGCRTLAVNYRLAPEFPFPSAVDDALAVMRNLRAEGHDPNRTALAGDSAGGNLSLATILALKERGEPLPAACVGISPWVDLLSTRPSHQENAKYDYIGPHRDAGWRDAYAGDADPQNPLLCPLYGDYTGFPPLLLQAGGAEVLRDDIRELAERARQMNVDVTYREWPDMVHVWHLMTQVVPEAKEAIAEIGSFVKAHIVDSGTFTFTPHRGLLSTPPEDPLTT